MKEYILDGEKYRFNGKRWIDSRGFIAPTGLYGKLNALLSKDNDFETMTDEELLDYAAKVKEGENFTLSIKALETLIERENKSMLRSALPRLTSCYRKMGRVDDAIALAEKYLSNKEFYVASPALYTSLGAAYCDIDNYEMARACANKAYALDGGKGSGELSALYGRINKFDENNAPDWITN